MRLAHKHENEQKNDGQRWRRAIKRSFFADRSALLISKRSKFAPSVWRLEAGRRAARQIVKVSAYARQREAPTYRRRAAAGNQRVRARARVMAAAVRHDD